MFIRHESVIVGKVQRVEKVRSEIEILYEDELQVIGNLLDQKKLKIARHESGHAVMAQKFGQRIQIVSLKEKDPPNGTGKYRGYMNLEPVDPGIKFTGEKAIQKITISLSGYASEHFNVRIAQVLQTGQQ